MDPDTTLIYYCAWSLVIVIFVPKQQTLYHYWSKYYTVVMNCSTLTNYVNKHVHYCVEFCCILHLVMFNSVLSLSTIKSVCLVAKKQWLTFLEDRFFLENKITKTVVACYSDDTKWNCNKYCTMNRLNCVLGFGFKILNCPFWKSYAPFICGHMNWIWTDKYCQGLYNQRSRGEFWTKIVS